MAKHHFRKSHKTPTRASVAHQGAGQMAAAPSGDGAPFIPPAAGGDQPQPAAMAGAPGGAPPMMSPGARMKGRYGAPPPDDGGM